MLSIDILNKMYETQHKIEVYTNKLFKRAGGKLEAIMHDTYKVSDSSLYMRCADKATKKYIK